MIEGRLALNGSHGVLCYEMPVTLALNIMYAALPPEAQEDVRLLVTFDALDDYVQEQMEERRALVLEGGGEIAGG